MLHPKKKPLERTSFKINQATTSEYLICKRMFQLNNQLTYQGMLYAPFDKPQGGQSDDFT